jgi:hypothetical protein
MTDPGESPELLSPTPTPSATPPSQFSTRQVFQQGAEQLVRAMEKIYSPRELCRWTVELGWDGGSFLVHPVVRRSSRNANANAPVHVPVDYHDSMETGELLWSDERVFSDPDVVAKDPLDDIESSQSEWIFSIVYSDTWRVPVLYFQVQQRNGTPCTRNYVLEVLTEQSHQNKVPDSWDFVSQEEHPVSRCPSFFLHPCRTQARLDILQASTSVEALRLLSWMSMIFPSVGCSISSRTFQQLKDRLD